MGEGESDRDEEREEQGRSRSHRERPMGPQGSIIMDSGAKVPEFLSLLPSLLAECPANAT